MKDRSRARRGDPAGHSGSALHGRLDASEFLPQRADVCRLIELHDLPASEREDVHPAKIYESAGSFRAFTARPEAPPFVPLRQEICRAEILNVEGIQQKSEELADFGNAPPQPA